MPFNIFHINFDYKESNLYILIEHISNYLGQKIYNYEWILLISNNNLFPINGIDNFKNIILDNRNKCDYWSIYNKIINNLCIEFNKKVLLFLLKFNKNNILVDLFTLLENNNFVYNYIYDKENLVDWQNDNKICILTLNEYLNNKIFFDRLDNSILNYIIKFI